MRYLFTVWIFLVALVSASAFAEDKETEKESHESQMMAPSSAQIQAIEQVSHWVGEWSGSGWSMSPDRQRQNFEIVERVEARLGNSVLVIEGKGESETDNGARKTTHESLAILSFDGDTNSYNWRTYDLRGSVRDPEFIVEPDSFRWGFRDEESGVLLRFVITIQDDTWYETGEVSPDDGENWYQILEMTLQRQ